MWLTSHVKENIWWGIVARNLTTRAEPLADFWELGLGCLLMTNITFCIQPTPCPGDSLPCSLAFCHGMSSRWNQWKVRMRKALRAGRWLEPVGSGAVVEGQDTPWRRSLEKAVNSCEEVTLSSVVQRRTCLLSLQAALALPR